MMGRWENGNSRAEEEQEGEKAMGRGGKDGDEEQECGVGGWQYRAWAVPHVGRNEGCALRAKKPGHTESQTTCS